MAQKVEEELRRLSVEIRLLEQTAEALNSRIRMVDALITDLTYTSMTLEGLEKESANAELLVPIGGGSYIKARLETPDKVTVGVGAGVSIEKTLQEAKEIIKKRLENLERNRAALQQQLSEVVGRLNEDRERFEELAAELTKEKPPKNV
ncbi:MAG: prefoldin subunit alpha [Nitrososphaerota archaeon]|nr:prefoldin subunit alpha [Candidatus Bathyarchaeota archaeon]MDW8022490.1 prefoldin subunit alpha [Nitrososphaerota archaeon]